jgi:hypothetical protein
MRTEEKLENIQAQLQRIPRNYLRQLSQETGLSLDSVYKAIKLVHICPHRDFNFDILICYNLNKNSFLCTTLGFAVILGGKV